MTRSSNALGNDTLTAVAPHPIGVFSEWGRLKEVLVGNIAHDVVPKWSPDWGHSHGFREKVTGTEGLPVMQAFPERIPAAVEQTNVLARTLEQHGVTVHRPRRLTASELASGPVGLAAQFARDPQVVIGKHIIETNLRMTFRNKEHLGYSDLFRRRVAEDPEARFVRMPEISVDLPGDTEEAFLRDPRPILEGGDTFVLGKDILVGFSGMGSSMAGIAWLRSYLGDYGYRVHVAALDPHWLHLDGVIAVIREGLGLCFRPGLKDARLPELLADWEFIEATPDEASTLGCNTLCLAPGVVVIGAEHRRLIREIEKRGASVIAVPFDKPSQSNGGIRCSTHPLAREA